MLDSVSCSGFRDETGLSMELAGDVHTFQLHCTDTHLVVPKDFNFGYFPPFEEHTESWVRVRVGFRDQG